MLAFRVPAILSEADRSGARHALMALPGVQ
jgi:hypothetical protein